MLTSPADPGGMRPLALATVLVATDLSRSSDIALETGNRLADAAGATLHVVHVREPSAREADESSSRESRDSPTHELESVLRRAGIPERRARAHTVTGSPADAIRALGEEVRADVIVVGPPREAGSDAHNHPLGGTARAIVAGARAPCLAAVRPLPLPLTRVLVSVDRSGTAHRALLVGLSWASALRAGSAAERSTTLVALHINGGDDAGESQPASSLETELDTLRGSAGTWAGVGITGFTAATQSSVAGEITRYAKEQRADLVVLGTRGLGYDEVARLGSVSGMVVERSPAAVLLVPPAGWREDTA